MPVSMVWREGYAAPSVRVLRRLLAFPQVITGVVLNRFSVTCPVFAMSEPVSGTASKAP